MRPWTGPPFEGMDALCYYLTAFLVRTEPGVSDGC